VLTFIDLDTKRLPDVITLPSIVFFFLAGFATGEVVWWQRALGAVLGYALVRIISDVYYYTTGREGLGLGDGKLLAMMGALLGWKALPAIVFAASLVGVLISIPVLLVHRRRRGKVVAVPDPPAATEAADQPTGGEAAGAPAAAKSLRHAEVPFGPFLSASALAYIFLQRHVWGFIEYAGSAIVGVFMQ
jgi:prepilin signal peptidase PulO-like enzyme (type II secretory pathway)